MNWGHRILIVFILGASFITYLVIRSFGVQTEMVEENYYAKELAFEGQINAQANFSEYPESISISQNKNTMFVQLDTALSKYISSGKIHFYCPSESSADKLMELRQSNSGEYTISTKGWRAGNYTAKIAFTANGKEYYKELNLYLN